MGPVYHTTQQLLTLIAGLGSNCSAPYFTETRNETVDGLKIMSVVVGAEHANKAAAPEKLRVMLTFGAHGREYFASEVAYKFLSTLCDGSDRSTNILNDVAFAIIPVFNPSGRTRTDSADAKGVRTTFLSEQQCTDRRKNGNLVDINRNFDVSWSMSDGSSGYEGDDDYRGPSAMSEVEPNTANKLRADWQPDMYMDLHTGTVAMYMPWNYKDESVADEQASKDMNTLLESVVSAKYESGKSIWDGSAAGVPSREPDVGIGSEVSYLASGTASDFMQSKGVKYTFIWEMYEASELAARRSGARMVGESSMRRNGKRKLPRGGGESLPYARPTDIAARRRVSSEPANALLPAGDSTRTSSTPDEWRNDECFKYFNPTTDAGLTFWLTTWNEALLRLNEKLIAVERSP